MADFDIEQEKPKKKQENFRELVYNIPDNLTMKEKIEVLNKLKEHKLRE